VYFAPATPGQGRYLRLDFKGHKGEVDLAFKNIPAAALSLQVSNMDGLPGQIVENGKSSAIQIVGLTTGIYGSISLARLASLQPFLAE